MFVGAGQQGWIIQPFWSGGAQSLTRPNQVFAQAHSSEAEGWTDKRHQEGSDGPTSSIQKGSSRTQEASHPGLQLSRIISVFNTSHGYPYLKTGINVITPLLGADSELCAARCWPNTAWRQIQQHCASLCMHTGTHAKVPRRTAPKRMTQCCQ